MEKLYKLIDADKLPEALALIQKMALAPNATQQQQSTLRGLRTYALSLSGRLGEARISLGQPRTPTPEDFRQLQFLDCFQLFQQNTIAEDNKQLQSPNLNYFLFAVNLYCRKFDLLDLKLKSKNKDSCKEREELAICLTKQFAKALQNQQLELDAVVQLLNAFMKSYAFKDEEAKRTNTSLSLNPRIQRQHANSIAALTVQFILMHDRSKLDKIEQLEALKPIMQALHPRMHLLMRCDSQQQIISALVKESACPDAAQFLLKNLNMVSDGQIAEMAPSNTQQLCAALRLKQRAELAPTLANALLVWEAAKFFEIDYGLLPDWAGLVKALRETGPEAKLAYLEQHPSTPKELDPAVLCLVLQLKGMQQSSGKPITQTNVLEVDEYPLLAFLFQNTAPAARQYLKQIQVANVQYLSTAEFCFPALLAEPCTGPVQLFCSHRYQNHTTTQLWDFQNVIQAIVMDANELVFQNYIKVQESLLECCNFYTAVRLFESKALLFSYQVYYATALYSCWQINSTDYTALSAEQRQLLFEGFTGRAAGLNSASNTFLYSTIYNLQDCSQLYFLEEPIVSFKLLQLDPAQRKKCSKQAVQQSLQFNELFEFVMEKPQLSQRQTVFAKQALRLHVFVRWLFLKANGVVAELESFFEELCDSEFDHVLHGIMKGEDVAERLAKLGTETVQHQLVERQVLEAAATALGNEGLKKAVQEKYGK